MKSKIFVYLIICSLLVVAGCESDKEFLTEKPRTFFTLENAFSTPAQVDAVLISCYRLTRQNQVISSNTSRILNGLGTDVLDVPELRIGTTFSDYARLNPTHGDYNTIFNKYYDIISKANTALYAAELENIAWGSDQEKNYAIAQAKFFRGYAYRSLGMLFGGVPIVDAIITYPKLDFVRSSTIETYQFAIDDLESSVQYLPEKSTQPGRIVKGAAQHFLVELYIAMGIEAEEEGKSGESMYDKALQIANQLIDGGTYSLMTERFGTRKDQVSNWSGTADVYWDLFQEGNVNYQDGNKESIWAYQIDFAAYLSEDSQSKIEYPRDYVPLLRLVEGMTGEGDDVGGRGVCFAAPTMHVRDGVWEGKYNKDNRNAEHNIWRNFKYNDPTHPKFGEPYPWSEYYKTDYNRSMVYPIHAKVTTDPGTWTGLQQGENRSNLFRDEYAVRLAETILLRAEIYYRKGQLQNAANDINLIRSRAKAEYMVTAADVNLDLILDERIRELYIEEDRWHTLLRMRGTVAVDRIRKYAFWPFTRTSLTWDFNKWPIPQGAIDRNIDAVLEQNPGWTQF